MYQHFIAVQQLFCPKILFFFVACLSNGSKMYSGDKLVYPTIYHKRSELFKYFSGLRRIAQGEKSVNCLSSCLFGCGHEIEA